MRRLRLAVIGLLFAGFVAAILWQYTHPPLDTHGLHWRKESGRLTAVGIDLENQGRWPVVLSSVLVDGRRVDYPEAMAVVNNTDYQLAGNAAASMDRYGEKLTTGPVQGWRLEPHRERYPGGSYGVRLDWAERAAGQVQVLVTYRYLGMPMRFELPDRFSTFK